MRKGGATLCVVGVHAGRAWAVARSGWKSLFMRVKLGVGDPQTPQLHGPTPYRQVETENRRRERERSVFPNARQGGANAADVSPNVESGAGQRRNQDAKLCGERRKPRVVRCETE